MNKRSKANPACALLCAGAEQIMLYRSAPRSVSFIALWLGVVVLSGCAQFPALDRTITPEMEAADYPDLVPIDPLLAQAKAGRIDPVQTEAELTGRAAQLNSRADRIGTASAGTAASSRLARLRARAARLRNAGLTSAERDRLQQDPAL